jgi:hypothetical protein
VSTDCAGIRQGLLCGAGFAEVYDHNWRLAEPGFRTMKPTLTSSLRILVLEFLIYGTLVAIYYFLVLHILGNSLNQLFQTDRRIYAGAALALIIGQGILLEMLTRLLIALLTSRSEGG